MKKGTFRIVCIIILLLTVTSGCRIKTEGDSLKAFTERLNGLYDDIEFSQSGYIYDDNKKTISKFYSTNKREILVCFTVNDNSCLSSMDIAFNNFTEDDISDWVFIQNCIEAFINDNDTVNSLIAESGIPDTLFNIGAETLIYKNGDVELLIDVTEIGTVITVVKNNL